MAATTLGMVLTRYSPCKSVELEYFFKTITEMLSIFQDGRHGLYWTTTIYLKVAARSQKMI